MILEKDFKSVISNGKDLFMPIKIHFKDDDQTEEKNYDLNIFSDQVSKSY